MPDGIRYSGTFQTVISGIDRARLRGETGDEISAPTYCFLKDVKAKKLHKGAPVYYWLDSDGSVVAVSRRRVKKASSKQQPVSDKPIARYMKGRGQGFCGGWRKRGSHRDNRGHN